MALKLFRISQTVNDGYDTFDSAVVVAASAVDACNIHPFGTQRWSGGKWIYDAGHDGSGFGWTVPTNVTAEVVGTAAKNLTAGEVVCASFNAG